MKTIFHATIKCVICLALCGLLSACFLRPYKFDIVQGNDLTPDKISQIQPGMSEDQVRYVLGTPMLNDVFHTNRWDYVYYEKPGYKKPIRRHLAVYFNDGRVAQVTNDTLPFSDSSAVA